MHLLKVQLINLSPLCLCSQHQLSATDQGPYALQIQYVDVQTAFTVCFFFHIDHC